MRQMLPDTPFTRPELLAAGVTQRQWRMLRDERQLREIVRDVFVDASLPDTLDLRLAAVARTLTPGQVVARTTAAWIAGLDVLSEPELSVVVFRATAGDAATDRILQEINASGRFHVASTTLDGHACIRLAFLNPATTRAHVEDVSDLIAAAAG